MILGITIMYINVVNAPEWDVLISNRLCNNGVCTWFIKSGSYSVWGNFCILHCVGFIFFQPLTLWQRALNTSLWSLISTQAGFKAAISSSSDCFSSSKTSHWMIRSSSSSFRKLFIKSSMFNPAMKQFYIHIYCLLALCGRQLPIAFIAL